MERFDPLTLPAADGWPSPRAWQAHEGFLGFARQK
jgi:hypothetical protein